MRWRLRQKCSLERADRQPDRLPFQVVDHVAVFNFTDVMEEPVVGVAMLRLDDSSETQRAVIEFAYAVLSSVGP